MFKCLSLVLLLLVGCTDLADVATAKGYQVCSQNKGYHDHSYGDTQTKFIKYTCKDGRIVRLSFEEYEAVSGEEVSKYLNKEQEN